jgi:hypothetical protein
MSEFFKDALVDIASNIIWIIILTAGSCLLYLVKNGFKTLKLFIRLKKNGIISFFPNRDSYTRDRPQSLEKYLETAEHSLLYVGHWLAVSIDQKNILDTFRNILLNKKTVTIVMLSDNLNPEIITKYANFFGRPAEDIKKQIENCWAIIDEWRLKLGAEEQKKLILKVHSEFIGHSAFLFDLGQKKSKALIDQKLWGLDRKNSYGIEFIANQKIDAEENTLFFRYMNSIIKLNDHASDKNI